MPPIEQATQEIRFAVVMYGGVSLAVYIHGVAQELLRLVRATSDADISDDPVACIYGEMSRDVRDIRTRGGGSRPTRFVIDILSGTSAGGINAVFLAKALAIRARHLNDLRNTWLSAGDIDKLFSRQSAFTPTRSLLNGNWMYQELFEAFDRMSRGECDPSTSSREQIDLYVTTTDLNGIPLPLRLTDMEIQEEIHKGFFHFRLDNICLTEDPHATALDVTLDKLCRNDFAAEYDPMLAFASRATSSFPFAFAPVKLADISTVIGTEAYSKMKNRFLEFFKWVPSPLPIAVKNPVSVEQRELADGGYLNNKPFDHVIDALTFRPAKCLHTRKLLFVDPFPEIAGDQSDQAHFDFVQNSLDAAITLPRYQTIRQEVQRIKESNRTQSRLHQLQNRVMAAPHLRLSAFAETTLDELTALYGPGYGTYHAVRLFDITDDIAYTVAGVRFSSDLYIALRYLVRAWRETRYNGNGDDGKEKEAKFFTDFDFSFRMRRAIHLLEWIRNVENSGETCDALIRQLTRLLRKREQLSLSSEVNPVWRVMQRLRDELHVDWDRIGGILTPIDDDERLRIAMALYKEAPKLSEVTQVIADEWKAVFDQNRDELARLRAANKELDEQYQRFDFQDMISLAFLEGSEVSEHTETEIYRISPADGINGSKLNEKLAGYKAGAFGAFLKTEWRQNDILWGRLDAATRIVHAVLNYDQDKELRDRYVSRLQEAILRQEYDLGMKTLAPGVSRAPDSISAQTFLENHYELPSAPTPAQSATRVAVAMDILGRMIEDDLDQKGRVASLLKTFGGWGVGLVALLTPGGVGRVFFKYWLFLLTVCALLIWAFAWLMKADPLRDVGIYGLAAAVLIWIIAKATGSYLSGKVPIWIKALVVFPVSLAIVAIILTGFRHLLPDAREVWNHIAESLSSVAGSK
jgi:patatin-related protein